ncbi:proline iminopeptidase [Podospora fimiseda]|uniref:Proline iminopeptidase n=1 Tax=Podospora fimiseda TaxID=252190 RepID=A0AAN7BMM5_9PEZI|nr:proline iminopeptidase [Podospora fimiseda]
MVDSTPISPATLITRISHVVPDALHITELYFQVPLDHANPQGRQLRLFGRLVRKDDRPIIPLTPDEIEARDKKPYLVYLEGGPGFGIPEPQNLSFTRYALSKGYQLLLLDYRGTGVSSPVDARIVSLNQDTPQGQADYLSFFRADNIVKDLEAVRQTLLPSPSSTWSIFGQSFGGFVCLTYLSFYPSSLREVFITGGLAPIKRTALEVYTALFKKVIERNEAYYNKYPEDIVRVKTITKHLIDNDPPRKLPGGGTFTLERFLSFGIGFGQHGGLDSVHTLILRLFTELTNQKDFTVATLQAAEKQIPLDANPIYAFLHEPIYCNGPGQSADFAAFRAGQALPQYTWLNKEQQKSFITSSDEPIYFTGEMIFPSYYESFYNLRYVTKAAEILAKKNDWPELYDIEQLQKNEVPVYAVSYVDDIYVDFVFARETARTVKGIKVYETNQMYHNALRAKTDEVIQKLFKMRDEELD